MKTITTKQVTEVIREFSAGFEFKRMTKGEVCDLRARLEGCDTIEEARIGAFCEIENLSIPEDGAFETLEAFKDQLKEEEVI